MVPHESRTYKLAKAALLAVLIAVTPVTAALRAQNKPAAAAPAPTESPTETAFKEAEKFLDTKKYKQALASYEKVEKLLGEAAQNGLEIPESLKAVLSFRKGSCYFFLNDWAQAEKELTNFLTKFPKGTEEFFEDKDNRRGIVELTIIDVFAKQAKYDEALRRLEKIRSSLMMRREDRVSAFALSAQILVDRSKDAPEAEKRTAYGQAVGLLKQAIAGGIDTPESREAAYKLVDIYAKLGLTKDAEQLKSEIDARSKGSPVEIIRSNFQKLAIADSRFIKADESGDEKVRRELYQQALSNYQGLLRRAIIGQVITKTIADKRTGLENATRSIPKPTDEQKATLDGMAAEIAQLEKTDKDFAANKDYDPYISYRTGLCLLALERPWEALVAFRDIFESNPGYANISGAYYYFITALRSAGRNTEAQTKCREFLQKYPKSPEAATVAIILGEISQDREDYKEAITHYKWVKTNIPGLPPDTNEEIDFRIAACNFAQLDWDDARVALDEFLRKYPRSSVRQQALYMNALCWFYQGKYKETKVGFDKYQQEYPKGQFLPDVRYRQAIANFGMNESRQNAESTVRMCEDWLRDFSQIKSDEVRNQVPEVHTLVGDANLRIATTYDQPIKEADIEVRVNARSPDRAKFVAAKVALEETKEKFTAKAVDAYERAAKTARTNGPALEFVLRELSKMLPGRGEHARMRALYQELYDWNHNDPKALTYLYEVIKSTERLGDRPEFRDRAEKTQKEYGVKLAEARAKADEVERKGGTKPAIDEAKAGVAKLSADLAAALDVIEKERQASLKKAKEDALAILSKSVAESIADRRQEGAERLIGFLAEKIAKRVKRVKPGAQPEPGAYTAADAEADLVRLMKLDQHKGSLIAQARGFYAIAQLGLLTRDPAKTDANFRKIAANYKAEELSPTLLAVVGDHLLAKGDHKKAGEYFGYIMEHARSSEYADYGFAGMAEIALGQKDFKRALDLTQEAIDNNVLLSKELEIRFVQARALAETGKYPEAKKQFEEIAKTKEWRGEKTAASLYWLGLMEERQNRPNEAIAYYRRCYLAWKKYDVWAAKAYLGTAKLLANSLNQKAEAKALIVEMLGKDRIKDTPEASEAKILSLKL